MSRVERERKFYSMRIIVDMEELALVTAIRQGALRKYII